MIPLVSEAKLAQKLRTVCTLEHIRPFDRASRHQGSASEPDRSCVHIRIGRTTPRNTKMMDAGNASVMCVSRRTRDGYRRILQHRKTDGLHAFRLAGA